MNWEKQIMVEKLDSYNLVEESHLHTKNKGWNTFLLLEIPTSIFVREI